MELRRLAIHGVPRSGTTLAGELINSSPGVCYKYQPLFSYALKDFIGPSSTKSTIDAFFDTLAATSDSFLDQDDSRRDGVLPQFGKAHFTHVAYKEVRYHQVLPNMLRQCPELRAILVARSPLSVISSWLRAPKEFRSDLDWSAAEEWRYAMKKNLNRPEEFNGYERWKDATRLFVEMARRFPKQVYLCEYRRLADDLRAETERMFSFTEIEFGEQTERFVELARIQTHASSYSVFRADPDDEKWRAHLDKEIVEAIKFDLKGTELERFLYVQDF